MTEAKPAADELRDLARLAFHELAAVPGGIHGLHRAIADRAFGATGHRAFGATAPVAAPARLLHDAISSTAYASVAGATRLAGAAADTALGLRRVRDGRALSSSPRGALLVGALNGLIGDALERDGSGLPEPIGVRVGGRRIEPAPSALADAFPRASGHVAVFLHGLMGTEFAWQLGAGTDRPPYATRLRHELGYTPVELRYNSGLHISENGRALADLLEELVAAWPAVIEGIALIGHSMGGLVARSACHQGSERGDDWVASVGQVVSLGSPHTGAPMAQGVQWASAALHAVPETRPLAGFLRRRSAGIRDLRQGSLVDEDWRDRDPDALRAVACREVPLLDGATHCFVAATVTRSRQHPIGRLLGDCLVLEPSASGRGRTRRMPFEAEHGMHLGGAHHLALLNHPAVYQRLRDWLDGSRGAHAPGPPLMPGRPR